MGGYHVAVRRATGNYIGVRSMLKLPSICVCVPDSNGEYNGVHPEFVHGFYKTISRDEWFGLDIGIIYRNNDWKVFYFGPSTTLTKTYDEKSISLSKGETIELASYIDEGSQSIRIEVNGRRISGIEAPLTDRAFSYMKKGCDITRELLMATNRTSGYSNLGARFEFAKFFKGMLTDKNRNRTPFIGNYEGSKGDEPREYNSRRVKHLGATEGYDGKVFGCEVGSCTFDNDMNFSINW